MTCRQFPNPANSAPRKTCRSGRQPRASFSISCHGICYYALIFCQRCKAFSKKSRFFVDDKIMFLFGCKTSGGKRRFCPFPPEVLPPPQNTLIGGGGSYTKPGFWRPSPRDAIRMILVRAAARLSSYIKGNVKTNPDYAVSCMPWLPAAQ